MVALPENVARMIDQRRREIESLVAPQHRKRLFQSVRAIAVDYAAETSPSLAREKFAALHKAIQAEPINRAAVLTAWRALGPVERCRLFGLQRPPTMKQLSGHTSHEQAVASIKGALVLGQRVAQQRTQRRMITTLFGQTRRVRGRPADEHREFLISCLAIAFARAGGRATRWGPEQQSVGATHQIHRSKFERLVAIVQAACGEVGHWNVNEAIRRHRQKPQVAFFPT